MGTAAWGDDGSPIACTTAPGRPFWSPDGRYVGVGGPTGLSIIAAGGGSAAQRICSCVVSAGATWAADGAILFAREDGLSRVAAGGGPVTSVTTVEERRGEFAHQYPLFLPDGRRFLYLARSRQPEHRGIYLTSLDDPARATRLLPDDSNASLAQGPDGHTYLFFVRDVTLLAQRFDVKSARLEGSAFVIAPRVVPGEAGRFAPFATGGRSLVFRQTTAPHNRVRWFDRRGIPQPGTFDIPGSFRYLALAPDGQRAALSQHDAETTKLDLWVHDLQRNVSERVTSDAVGAFFPVWIPDGDRSIYASAREGPWHLFWRATHVPTAGVFTPQGRRLRSIRPMSRQTAGICCSTETAMCGSCRSAMNRRPPNSCRACRVVCRRTGAGLPIRRPKAVGARST